MGMIGCKSWISEETFVTLMGIPIHSTKDSLILGGLAAPPISGKQAENDPPTKHWISMVGLVSLSTPPGASFGGTPGVLLAPGSELH